MRLHVHRSAGLASLAGLAFALLLGCQPGPTAETEAEIAPTPETSSGTVPAPASAPATAEQKQMATLAFLSYLGDDLKGSDEEVENKLDECVTAALQTQEGVGGWSLAWGPAVYHFSLGRLDDNMMYVVRDTANPSRLAIAVRGTNPSAVLDWAVEDLEVVRQVPWSWGGAPADAKISRGTSEGLKVLQTMTAEGGPVPGKTLLQFLEDEAGRHASGLDLLVTGHSLGGALSPALALWLSETLGDKARISVYPLAGPTPGNAAFAAFYDGSAVGKTTDRMWNPYDIVPLAWNYETLGTWADLYEPVTRADAIERGLIDALRAVSKDKGYIQIQDSQPALPGALYTDPSGKTSWAGEAGWQHHCGYQCALGINVLDQVPGCPSKGPQYTCPPEACPK